ncbi:hypothetical protein NKDENANG_00924 [Candidatus Entotheonellaceae bacterium PAL068K]
MRVIARPLPYTPYTFHDEGAHGIVHPQLVAWFQRLLAGELSEGDVSMMIYKHRPNLIYTVPSPTPDALPWSHLAIKQFGWRGLQHYVLSPLTASKALKSYKTACHLLTHDLLTPLPLGAYEARRWGFVQSNVYVTEAITEYVTLREYCTTLPDGPQGMAEIMHLVAAYARCMHDSGLWHRDLFLANFLMTGPPGRRRVYLIDLNRACRLPYIPAWLRAIDLARLEWRAWQPQFVNRYCAGRFSARHFLFLMRLHSRWRTWRRRVLRAINPLRRRLGLK